MVDENHRRKPCLLGEVQGHLPDTGRTWKGKYAFVFTDQGLQGYLDKAGRPVFDPGYDSVVGEIPGKEPSPGGSRTRFFNLTASKRIPSHFIASVRDEVMIVEPAVPLGLPEQTPEFEGIRPASEPGMDLAEQRYRELLAEIPVRPAVPGPGPGRRGLDQGRFGHPHHLRVAGRGRSDDHKEGRLDGGFRQADRGGRHGGDSVPGGFISSTGRSSSAG